MTDHEVLVRLWVAVMEPPTLCWALCGRRAVWKDYPGSEQRPSFGGPWNYTPQFSCAEHRQAINGRVGGPV